MDITKRTYPKINSLFDRDVYGNLLIGQYCRPEFSIIERWDIYEKIDGTNIRIIIDGDDIYFKGRTNADNNIPTHLLEFLKETYTKERLQAGMGKHMVIFGEGYGHKIQAVGSKYMHGCEKVGFIGFDILVGNHWIEQKHLEGIFHAMGIKRVPKISSCVPLGKSGHGYSNFLGLPSALNPSMEMEGIIARPHGCELQNSRNERVIWKLKNKDFEK